MARPQTNVGTWPAVVRKRRAFAAFAAGEIAQRWLAGALRRRAAAEAALAR
jgi:hypothetical protein